MINVHISSKLTSENWSRFPNIWVYKAEFIHTLSKSKEKNVILLQILSI